MFSTLSRPGTRFMTRALWISLESFTFRSISHHWLISSTYGHRDFSGTSSGAFPPGATVLDFEDHSVVFRHKGITDLLRALLVLHACAFDSIVSHSYKLLSVGERVLGERVLGLLLAPFYRQFVAGDSEFEMASVTTTLAEVGIRLMVAPMLESDLDEGKDWTRLYTNNLAKTCLLVQVSARNNALGGARPICQTKMTAHLQADIMARVSDCYIALTFDQRVAMVKILGSVIKQGGLALQSSSLLHPLSLSPGDQEELLSCLRRLNHLGSLCVRENVTLAVDAEYTYVNPAINLLTLAMMSAFNTDAPIIWNTYQCYLKKAEAYLEHDLAIAKILGRGFGAKLVRGAYLEKERSRAAQMKYPDPVNETFEDTGTMYDNCVRVMLKEISVCHGGREVIVATHNEASVKAAVHLLQELNINPMSGSVVFAQIYGMAENISVALARAGYLVYKSVPYGSVSEVLPYLSRRANENRAVMLGARRERQLLAKEIIYRLSPRRFRDT